jgi:hypothetical protein
MAAKHRLDIGRRGSGAEMAVDKADQVLAQRVIDTGSLIMSHAANFTHAITFSNFYLFKNNILTTDINKF